MRRLRGQIVNIISNLFRAKSPVIDAGVGPFSYVKSDIDSQMRNKQDDVGADEFQASPH